MDTLLGLLETVAMMSAHLCNKSHSASKLSTRIRLCSSHDVVIMRTVELNTLCLSAALDGSLNKSLPLSEKDIYIQTVH